MTVGEPFSPYKKFTGYFIPECVMNYGGISSGAKMCLAVLYRMIGKQNEDTWPKQETIAEKMGCSTRSVASYIAELEKDGFIRSVQRGLCKSNIYAALWHRIYHDPEEVENDDFGNANFAEPGLNVPSEPERKVLADPSIELKRVIEENHNNKKNYPEVAPDEETTGALSVDSFLLRIRSLKGTHYSGAQKKRIPELWQPEWSEMTFEQVLPLVDEALQRQPRRASRVAGARADVSRGSFTRTGSPSRPASPQASSELAVPIRTVILNNPRFQGYLKTFLLAGKELTDPMMEDGYRLWLPLTEEQQDLAAAHAERNFPKWSMIPSPAGHLSKKPWTAIFMDRILPEPGRKLSKHEEAMELARRQGRL